MMSYHQFSVSCRLAWGIGWVGDLRRTAFSGLSNQGVSRPSENCSKPHTLSRIRLHPVHQSRRFHDVRTAPTPAAGAGHYAGLQGTCTQPCAACGTGGTLSFRLCHRGPVPVLVPAHPALDPECSTALSLSVLASAWFLRLSLYFPHHMTPTQVRLVRRRLGNSVS
jgi:hypothetical protein